MVLSMGRDMSFEERFASRGTHVSPPAVKSKTVPVPWICGHPRVLVERDELSPLRLRPNATTRCIYTYSGTAATNS